MIKSVSLESLDSLFLNYKGWSGGDGIFSFNYLDQIIFYFSDTFIGESTLSKKRINFHLINNSLAILKDKKIKFYYPSTLESVFVPKIKDHYYWLQDGIIENDKLYISSLLMKNDIFSNQLFEIKGIDLIELKLPFEEKIEYKIHPIKRNIKQKIIMTSILKKDGYYYFYSYLNEFNNKKLILCRSRKLINPTLEYLSNDGVFKKEDSSLMILKEHFSSEFKVVYLRGYYYIAYTKNSIGKDIFLTRAKEINSPFEEEIFIYSCKEHKDNIITYNSKIQLALSNEEELVISYNVNTLVNEEHVNLDIYRPRFFNLKWEDIENEFKKIK